MTDRKVDCIVVSGLSSHPFGSWKDRGGHFMWLVDDVDCISPNVRLLLYGYDTSLLASKSFQGVADIGERLSNSVRSIRARPSIEPRPLVFIAHSLGGLVVKETVCHMAKADPASAMCIYGLVFFGVPHRGLLVEPWLRMVHNQPNKKLIENLRLESPYLQSLDKNFREAFIWEASNVISIYETMESKTVIEETPGNWKRSGDTEVLVPPSSARGSWPECAWEVSIGVNRSHEDLPKFRGAFDEDYLALRPHLDNIWSLSITTIRKRSDTYRQAPSSIYGGPEDLRQNQRTLATDTANEKVIRGLQILWPSVEIEERVEIPTLIDVIAIHGLGGHALKTWTDGEKLWLRDLLPWDIPEARVLTFGYDSSFIFRGAKADISGFALQLLESIRQLHQSNKTKKTEENRKAIFICHGLGGIIFKQIFLEGDKNPTRYNRICKSVAGVIFLGTPHHDASVDYWSTLLNKLARLYRGQSELLNNPEAKSLELGGICSKFVEKYSMRLRIFSLYERLVVPGHDSLIVDDYCAKLHVQNEVSLPLDADHQSTCRYLTNSSPDYLTFRSCISELMDEMTNEQTFWNSSQHEFISQLRPIDAIIMLDLIPSPWGNSSKWLLSHADFQSWTSLRGRQVVWIYGPPGSGKSVLMRSVVSYLLKKSESEAKGPIIGKPLYFFFDDSDLRRKTSDAFIRSILDQILSDSQTAFMIKYLDGFLIDLDHRQKTIGNDLNEEDLWKCLSIILERESGVMFQLVVDAVDESLRHTSGSATTIIDQLERLIYLDMGNRVRIMISNRTKPSHEFRGADIAAIDVDNVLTQNNVYSFVRAQIHKSAKRPFRSISSGESLERTILGISRGNYLHAKLACEQFSNKMDAWSEEEIQGSLMQPNAISYSLVTAYCKLLKGIPGPYRKKARAAFAILRISQAKLTSHQLAFLACLSHHLPLQVDATSYQGHNVLRKLNAQCADLENYIREACGYIIHVSKDDAVDFTHVSAKNLFVESSEQLDPECRQVLVDYIISDPTAHAMMHEICMAIFWLEQRNSKQRETIVHDVRGKRKSHLNTLSSDSISMQEAEQLRQLLVLQAESFGRTPCFVYALRYWITHFEAATPSADKDNALALFLPTVSSYYQHLLWFEIYPIGPYTHLTTYGSTHASSPSVARGMFRLLTVGDCPRIVKTLLVDGVNPDSIQCPKDAITLLSWAIICNREESFRVLLRNDNINVNYGDPLRPKPLHYAAQSKNLFFLQRLLEYPRVNVNILADTGSPLHAAMRAKNVAAVEILLNHPYIDIWSKSQDNKTPYAMAFHNNIWESVLRRMLEIDSTKALTKDISEISQFLMAGVHSWTDVEEEIISSDPKQLFAVDPCTGMNAFVFYAYFGRREKLIWILDRLPSRNLPFRNESENYDLQHLCANQNWEDIVHRLRRDHDMTSLPSDHAGRTLLHWAMDHNWDINKIDNLADFCASNLNVRDRDGLTAIHLAVSNRNMAAIKRLVSSGASYSLKDKNGMTPAHLAADMGYRAALEYFIDRPQNEFFRTATKASLLHLVALWFDGSLVKRLVKSKGALVNVVDKNRRIPLHYAAMNNNFSAAKQLVALHSIIDAKDASVSRTKRRRYCPPGNNGI
ncbi:ankyrin repeat protein [Xylaria digitata]|nr:ankyrin repeat protein [Xylaria digitata]